MLKEISAMKARQNLGQLLTEFSLRGDSHVIQKAWKSHLRKKVLPLLD